LRGRTPGKVKKAFERSLANAGEYFDLEAAQVGQALGTEWGTSDITSRVARLISHSDIVVALSVVTLIARVKPQSTREQANSPKRWPSAHLNSLLGKYE
jgi:hypothetical protein